MADIHGRIERLEQAERLLTKDNQNHVLITLGDFVDRGKHSLEVVEKLIAMKAEGKEIYALAGNHEKYCLETIAAFEKVSVEILKTAQQNGGQQYIDENLNPAILENYDINFHRNHNGGEWLFELYVREAGTQIITFTTEGARYHPDSKVLKVKKFLESLPTIIALKASATTTALIAAHGDLRFNSSELMRRVTKARALSPEERQYILEARLSDFETNDRSPSSILTYLGHNIFGSDFPAVRKEVNAISIDGGDLAIIINHTKKEAILLENPPEVLTEVKLKEFAAIQEHLALQKKYQLLIEKIMTQADTLVRLDEFVCKDLNTERESETYDQFILFMFYQGSLASFEVGKISEYYPKLKQQLAQTNDKAEKRPPPNDESLSKTDFFKKSKIEPRSDNGSKAPSLS